MCKMCDHNALLVGRLVLGYEGDPDAPLMPTVEKLLQEAAVENPALRGYYTLVEAEAALKWERLRALGIKHPEDGS
ncbi:hypothetical protein ACIO3O_36885 [Streptomyces sp. NPDC087440]|uniref:hypothetical protein n=1 Tax=Streptomyces sp. NPDC087440 TaxID=3365790 RepID=UPI003804BD9E